MNADGDERGPDAVAHAVGNARRNADRRSSEEVDAALQAACIQAAAIGQGLARLSIVEWTGAVDVHARALYREVTSSEWARGDEAKGAVEGE